MKKAIVIGAGLGGLSCAIRLAHAGFAVTVLEQQSSAGGKLQRIQSGQYVFDRGPSTITMPAAFEQLFRSVGRQMDDYIKMYPLLQGTSNYFADGNKVIFNSDAAEMEEQIAAYSSEDARQYRAFMSESASLYQLAERHFMNRLLVSWQDKLHPSLLAALWRVKPFQTLDQLLRKYFRHPHTLAMFGRFATYVGSNPAKAPAIFAMLPHLEIVRGTYGISGGTYSLVQGLVQMAKEFGVDIRTSVRVNQIVTRQGRVVGVETEDATYEADTVIANGDALTTYRDLLAEEHRPEMKDQKLKQYEPSLSGYVIMAGMNRQYTQLQHHNVFFPQQYGSEFDDIFIKGIAPIDPAIYVCHSGYSEAGMAPIGGSNLFILVNAPYTSARWSWEEQHKPYGRYIVSKLSEYGLDQLETQADVLMTYHPEQLERDTSAFYGSIYGISSNTIKQTFMRPSNRAKLKGLWFVGGTTHPGGGTPLVVTSGQLVAESIIKQSRFDI
ncbi:phytoene desaturase family protein [Paenibacillus assamensis]|uniref:phytoene desaturase family protein n=1 Tax=Paenibacillus assamensis TaxID=311244 RepID=UPI000429D07A|nr:phytoene desaturase family protein [Paenibacillus assamensis]